MRSSISSEMWRYPFGPLGTEHPRHHGAPSHQGRQSPRPLEPEERRHTCEKQADADEDGVAPLVGERCTQQHDGCAGQAHGGVGEGEGQLVHHHRGRGLGARDFGGHQGAAHHLAAQGRSGRHEVHGGARQVWPPQAQHTGAALRAEAALPGGGAKDVGHAFYGDDHRESPAQERGVVPERLQSDAPDQDREQGGAQHEEATVQPPHGCGPRAAIDRFRSMTGAPLASGRPGSRRPAEGREVHERARHAFRTRDADTRRRSTKVGRYSPLRRPPRAPAAHRVGC